MKVLHFISSLGYGGAERLLADLLPILKKMGVQVSVVSMTDQVPLAVGMKKSGISVYSIDHHGTIYRIDQLWKARRKIRMILHKENPDIVHSHLYIPDILSRLTAPLKCKLITTLHQTDPWWNEKKRLRSVVKTWLDIITGKLRKIRYITISKDVGSFACQNLNIPKERVRIISNGINLLKFQFIVRDRKSNQFKIIQVGRFYEVKGHKTSIKAFKILKHYYPDAKLIFVGVGPLLRIIEHEVKDLQLEEAVEFKGVRDDVQELLQQADVFWMPSEWEGLPIACLEAMACGLPVIASSVGGLQELVLDGKTGYLIERGSFEQLTEKTIEILSNSSLAMQMGLAGRQRVEQFYSIEETAKNYVKAYKDLLEGIW